MQNNRHRLPVIWILIDSLLAILAVVFVVLIVKSSSGGPASPPIQPAIGSTRTGQLPTFPATWTPLPTLTPFPTRTPQGTPTIDLTATANNDLLKAIIQSQVVDDNGGSGYTSPSIDELNQLIQANPDEAEAYFMRGQAYVELSWSTQDKGIYLSSLDHALADLDTAIQLDPSQGIYFEYRAFVFWNQADIAKYRVDQDRLYGIALDNMRIAARLSPHGIGAQSNVLLLMGKLGRCQEALDYAAQIVADGTYTTSNIGHYHFWTAQLLLCTGKYTEALDEVEQAIQEDGILCDYLEYRAIILLNADRKDSALAGMDQCIHGHPQGMGERYYFRALMEYDRGETNLVLQDLQAGADNSLRQDGLYSYVQARLAWDSGNRGQALALIQDAEATMNLFSVGPAIMDRVRHDLEAMGAAPLSPTPDTSLMPVTPMPADFPDVTP